MASCHIVRRGSGKQRRYIVRYRLGGRESRLVHAGSHRTERLAVLQRNEILADLAAGRIPRLHRQRVFLRDSAQAWLEHLTDVSDGTMRYYTRHANALAEDLGDTETEELSYQDVNEYLARLTIGVTSVHMRLRVLRMILDYAGLEPNPARSKHVRAPKYEQPEIKPPPLAHVTAMLAHMTEERGDIVRVLLDTGLRVGEFLRARPDDIQGDKLLVRSGKTANARRWVPVSQHTISYLSSGANATLNRRQVYGYMAAACEAAGIPRYSPHDLRHRHISLLVKQGVPLPEIRARVGHARASFTLDTYSHVLLED